MNQYYVSIDDILYYNGAEQYINENWVLYSNVKNTHGTETNISLKLSGLICRISPHATDRFGHASSHHFAIELPERLGLSEQKEAINKEFDIIQQLSKKYEQLFYKQNVVPQGYFSWNRPCYFGCEKEYGLQKPIINTDYGK